jgi:hypothetical protein
MFGNAEYPVRFVPETPGDGLASRSIIHLDTEPVSLRRLHI